MFSNFCCYSCNKKILVAQKDSFRYNIDMMKITEDIVQAEKQRVFNLLKGVQFERERHGSLYDRGTADSYYHRTRSPHWYPNGTGNSPRISDLTAAEIAEYNAGYDWNERFGDKKDWE